MPVSELLEDHPELREPVIHGLLRQGETMNVIAATKAGKSWLLLDLVTSLATGRPWLDTYPVEKGRVLILDNELHEETIASRIPRVAEARGVPLRDFASNVDVASLRGGLEDVLSLAPWVSRQTPGRWKLVVLDAFYRFMPADSDENDNGTMAASTTGSTRTRGTSAARSSSSTTRRRARRPARPSPTSGRARGAEPATDTHLVLRPHEEDGCVVLDAAVRSWPPVEPRCLRWTFPVWNPDDSLDPEALSVEGRRQEEGGDARGGALDGRTLREVVRGRAVHVEGGHPRQGDAGRPQRTPGVDAPQGRRGGRPGVQMPRGPRDPAVYQPSSTE